LKHAPGRRRRPARRRVRRCRADTRAPSANPHSPAPPRGSAAAAAWSLPVPPSGLSPPNTALPHQRPPGQSALVRLCTRNTMLAPPPPAGLTQVRLLGFVQAGISSACASVAAAPDRPATRHRIACCRTLHRSSRLIYTQHAAARAVTLRRETLRCGVLLRVRGGWTSRGCRVRRRYGTR